MPAAAAGAAEDADNEWDETKEEEQADEEEEEEKRVDLDVGGSLVLCIVRRNIDPWGRTHHIPENPRKK